MAEDFGTLNEVGESSNPVDQPLIDPDSTNIIGTVEGLDEKGPGESSEETLKTDEGGKTGKETDQEKELPFHNHPRWKEVMSSGTRSRPKWTS
jgi:hypothetical protein